MLDKNYHVIGIDNLSSGQSNFLSKALLSPNFSFHNIDLLDIEKCSGKFQNIDIVFHFAANADVRFGTLYPKRDLEQNTLATFNVLECMRLNDVKKIVFSSTGSIYGDNQIIPTPEDAFSIQTSLYGASKQACEGLISAYCEGFGMQGYIFRFVSILGERYTHGHVFDFCKSLINNNSELQVLGNGLQRKSYLYIQDCINAIFVALNKSSNKVNFFNLGNDEYCEVNNSIEWICNKLNVSPKLKYTGGDRGWVGDSPFIFLDTKKIKALGWKPEFTIKQGIEKTVDFIISNKWIFKARK